MLAGANVSADFVLPTVASVVDVVVHVALGADGVRRVTQICTVSGRIEGTSIEMHEVFALRAGVLHATGPVPAWG